MPELSIQTILLNREDKFKVVRLICHIDQIGERSISILNPQESSPVVETLWRRQRHDARSESDRSRRRGFLPCGRSGTLIAAALASAGKCYFPTTSAPLVPRAAAVAVLRSALQKHERVIA